MDLGNVPSSDSSYNTKKNLFLFTFYQEMVLDSNRKTSNFTRNHSFSLCSHPGDSSWVNWVSFLSVKVTNHKNVYFPKTVFPLIKDAVGSDLEVFPLFQH